MSKKLHVSNLADSVTDQSLKEAFARYGAVAFAAVLKDAGSGANHRVGLIEMSDEAGAVSAIRWLNFSTFEGQIIAVRHFRDAHPAQ